MRWLIVISLLWSIVLGGSWEKEFIFSENDLVIEDLDGYDYIRMPGFMNPTEGGAPMIPFYSVSILIPPTAEITEVTITEYEMDTISGKYYLYPAQPPVPIGETIPFVPPNDSIYSLETEYPENRAVGIRSGCKSGYRIAGLFLFPISYIPKDSILFLYTKLKVHIEYEEGKYETQYLTASQKDLFSKDVEKLVINPEKINQYEPPTHQVDGPEIDYVIITSSGLTAGFLPLVTWLRKTGIWTVTKSTDWISSNYTGRDLQEQIRNFNIDYFNNHGLKYVLLAGDVSIVPARLARVFYRVTGNIPCDLYYTDLEGTWDDDSDYVYGEPGEDSVDLYYELYLGRVSVEDSTEVLNFITKLLIYEKTPDTLYQKRLLLPARPIDTQNYMQSQDSIANLSPVGWIDRVIDLDNRPHDSTVKDSIDSGFAFCHFVSHGDTASALGLYWIPQPSQQNNDSTLLIANAVSCWIGDFTSDECLAEEMMNAEACAIGVIMNSHYGWSVPHGFGPSEELDMKFYEFLFSYDTNSIATIHQWSKEVYRNSALHENCMRWCYYALNLLGEPSMPMWTDNPRTMIADFPEFIYNESQEFTVTVTTDTIPISNALVCLWKGTEIYKKGTTDGSGMASFDIIPLSTGNMYVTVTAKNKLPVEDSCRVCPLPTDRRLKVNERLIISGGATINRVTAVPEPDLCAWAVGDSGQVFKLTDFGCVDSLFTLNAEYNLTGVSFANSQIGYIVGYKRDSTENGPKWKGAIWKTTNGGDNWERISDQQLPPFNLPTPFLDVHAVNANVVWISCGHGYVIWTRNGGESWYRTTSKPGGVNHFGWLWGIDAPDENTAWVCSDGSGLIAMTTNGGDTWTNYEPYETDSLSFFDIDFYNDEAVVAASKGKLLSGINGNWNEYFPFGSSQTAQWFYGSFNLEQKWGVGSGGMIGSYGDSARKYWYSKQYDLHDIDGVNYSSYPWENRYFMVGTNKAILFGREIDVINDSGIEEPDYIPEADPEWTFNVLDSGPDHGWRVTGTWENVGADSYRIYCSPKCRTNLYGTTGYGYPCWIMTADSSCTSFNYNSALTGQTVNYTIVAFSSGQPKSASDTCTATDDIEPPKVTGLQGRYNDTLDAVQIWWNPVPQKGDPQYPDTFEPNLAGYWVCPETIGGVDFNINHPCPLNRNYYIEKVPDWVRGHYWGFWVCAMDRSGNRGDWSDSVLIWIPNNQTNSPFATAFNQGRHLVRIPDDNFNIVYEDEGEIIHSYSINNGESWQREEIENGFFPSIGVDQEDFLWITYWQEGDIICKVKNDKGYSKKITVFDGGDTCWAGPPAIALGTVPDVSPPIPAFAYITYSVFISGDIPTIPDQPPQTTEGSYIRLSILDTIDIAHYTIDEGTVDSLVCWPAVGVTPGDLVHIVWQKGDEIWYVTNYEIIEYNNWQNVQMQDKMNISQSPDTVSEYPFVEAYGDHVYAAWKEKELGEIIRRVRDITLDCVSSWGPKENISESPDLESNYPVVATPDVVVYQEQIEDKTFEIFAWINDEIVNLSKTSTNSRYPHIEVEPPSPVIPDIVIDAIWTEEIKPDTMYEVKFKRYIHPTNPEDIGEYLSVATGESIASPYCEHRDGFVHYGQYSLDYADSLLIYNLPYLHPKSNYLLKAKMYHALTGRWREKILADSILGADVYFDPNVPTTVNILLPKASYSDDFRISKEIEKILGRFAVITDFKIYEVSIPDTGGGAQNVGLSRILRTALYQNRPNPFKSNTVISFSLAKESKVSCLIFDASGRKVRTIVNDKLQPGHYNLKWDGKDNHNRKLAQGIYFYRLQTEDFKDTKKTILLK
jgi:photosystem II stability/assembly factor-like uncharacterized protein